MTPRIPLLFAGLTLLLAACDADGTAAGGDGGSDTSGSSSTTGAGGDGVGPAGSGAGGSAAGGMSATGGGATAAGGSAAGGAGGQGGSAPGGAGGGTGGGPTGGGGSGGGSVGSTTPCQSGPGWTLWRLSWGSNSAGYATVDAWDNGCAYSLANQACSLSGEPHDDANWGPGVVFNSSTDYFRVRFSVQGLSFTSATVYLSAHADGSGIPNAWLQSPLHGDIAFAPMVPISQHQNYAVDWSQHLFPTDDPNLTAVTLRSQPSGFAVSFMELCVQ